MNDRFLDAYYEYCLALTRAGIIAILDGKTIDEHMVDVFRAVGTLPAAAPPKKHRVVGDG